MHLHAFRLQPGQDLKQEIQAFARQEKVEAGWIITCVGSLTDYHLRFADHPNGKRGKGHYEIVSLVGTVSLHGSHIHMSISDELGQTIGGHLLDENLVYTTAEIVIGSSDELVFTREDDETTGYRELQIRKKAK